MNGGTYNLYLKMYGWRPFPNKCLHSTFKTNPFPKDIHTIKRKRHIEHIEQAWWHLCCLMYSMWWNWFESNVAKESCSWMLFIHFFLFLMKNQRNMHVTFELHSSHSFHLINDIHDQAYRSINDHGNKQF